MPRKQMYAGSLVTPKKIRNKCAEAMESLDRAARSKGGRMQVEHLTNARIAATVLSDFIGEGRPASAWRQTVLVSITRSLNNMLGFYSFPSDMKYDQLQYAINHLGEAYEIFDRHI